MGNLASKRILSIIGMSVFWMSLRYQAVFGVLFPADRAIGQVDFVASPFLVFILFVLLASLFVVVCPQRTARWLQGRVVLPIVVASSVGSAVGIGAQSGMFPIWACYASSVVIALGFVVCVLVWARYCSETFGFTTVLDLAASYAVSLIVFTFIGTFAPSLKELIAIAAPTATGIFWYFLNDPQTYKRDVQKFEVKHIEPYLALFVGFMLSGSVVRGVVDSINVGAPSMYLRWGLSVAIALAILFGCWYRFGKRESESGSALSQDVAIEVENLSLKFWMGLAILFFAGVLSCLLLGSYSTGGQLVVVVRSTLDFLLWVLLCTISRNKNIQPQPLFAACFLVCEALSWFISYEIVPRILTVKFNHFSSAAEMLLLILVFSLIALIIVVSGLAIMRVKSKVQGLRSSNNLEDFDIDERLHALDEYLLTNRELEMVSFLSQGYTLSKVAAKMYISKSTAQTHAKSIYRKIGVHSKDDLIDVLVEKGIVR